MRRRGFSPGPSGVPSVTPKATSEAPTKPLLGHALFWIALHMTASSCLMILNKLAVFKDTAAKAPTLPVFTVMSLQTAFSVAVVVRERRAVTQRIALQWLPVALLFITMLGSSSLALSMKSVSVSFLVVFRNLIAVFVAAFEFFVQGQGISMGRFGGLLAMLQGAGLYAVGDAAAAAEIYDQKSPSALAETAQLHSWRFFGYTMVAINLASTFAYNIVCKRALRKMELPPNVAALLNNAYALPVFVSAAAYFKGSGDLSVLDFAEEASPVQWLVLALSCAVGHCLSVAGLNVQRLISATSFTVPLHRGLAACVCSATVRALLNFGLQVIVNTSKAVTLFMGVYLLKETANACASAGMCLSVVGAAMYALLP